uniref:NADAR domain protein n=1 Tax=Pithovirus LCPAC103 TaxID=2506588 RepID=A0A481Z4R8_9VIRU|nr:MAG: NADAR domain protein [Pithovirus LCPAC103]
MTTFEENFFVEDDDSEPELSNEEEEISYESTTEEEAEETEEEFWTGVLAGAIEDQPDFPVKPVITGEELDEEAEIERQLAEAEIEAGEEFEEELEEFEEEESFEEAPQFVIEPVAGVTGAEILFHGVKGDYGEFSNFWDNKNQRRKYRVDLKLVIDGQNWGSTEEYFQSQKFVTQGRLGQGYIQYIRAASTQPKKKALGGFKRMSAKTTLDPNVHKGVFINKTIEDFENAGLKLRPDWDAVKVSVMEKAVTAKFTQNETLRNLLVATDNRRLAENSPRDAFWGLGKDGRGQNQLGRILMALRSELAPTVAPTPAAIPSPTALAAGAPAPVVTPAPGITPVVTPAPGITPVVTPVVTPVLAITPAPAPTALAITPAPAPTPTPTPTPIPAVAPAPAPTPVLLPIIVPMLVTLRVLKEGQESDEDYRIRKLFSEKAYSLLQNNGLDTGGAILVGRCFLNMIKSPGLAYDKSIVDIIQYVKSNG